MEKHAYLIMAHDEFSLLKKAIVLMDFPGNDIYIHVDAKVKNFEPESFSGLCQFSGLHFTQRIPVTWGAYSQIAAELVLLKAATPGHYDYYHLLSGSDLPIKPQAAMHAFFEERQGLELIAFDQRAYATKDFYERINQYHFFQEWMGKSRSGILGFLNKASQKIQEWLKVNRIAHSTLDFNKGLNWFSITHDLAEYVLSQENFIRKTFQYTLAADEVFLHTLIWNSEFKDRVCSDITRVTKKGRPYFFRAEDFDFLMRSPAFWARKFSEAVDPVIVQKIYDHLKLPEQSSFVRMEEQS